MSDDKPRDLPTDFPADQTQPVRPGAALPPAPGAAPDPAPAGGAAAYEPAVAQPAARRGFRDRFRSLRSTDGSRTFGLAALVASALAGVIVGGLGGAAVHAVTDGHDRGGWMEQRGPGGRFEGDRDGSRGPGQMFGGPGAPGQPPPATTPEDDDSDS
jgi:hypothetical protein